MNVTERLFVANQELSLLLRDRDATQQLGPPSSAEELQELERYFEWRRLPISPSYFAFLIAHNGWGDFVAKSRILSTRDHGADWVLAAMAGREDLASNQPISHLVPMLLGSLPSSPAAFFDPSMIGADHEPVVIAVDSRQGVTRHHSFLALLQEYLSLVEGAVRAQREGD